MYEKPFSLRVGGHDFFRSLLNTKRAIVNEQNPSPNYYQGRSRSIPSRWRDFVEEHVLLAIQTYWEDDFDYIPTVTISKVSNLGAHQCFIIILHLS